MPGPVAIVGGSVGGLFAANMLHRRGWDVHVFERATGALASRGAGIARHDEMKAVMAAAGVDYESLDGVEMTGRTLLDQDGSLLEHFPYAQRLSAWGAVYRPLHAAFPADRYHTGAELQALRTGKRCTLGFADGTDFEAALVIGADGFRSKVRTTVAPHVTPEYAGYVAWRGIVDPARLSERFRKEILRRYTFFFPKAGHFASFPLTLDTAGSGRQTFSFLWYDHVEDGEPLDDLLTDDDGLHHDYSISPHRIRREHIEKIRARARDELPGILAEIVEATDNYLLQPIYDVLSDRMDFRNIALVGDAAFVVRPHVGTGVLKAGEDAMALADCLDAYRDPADALAAFESVRLPIGRDSVQFSRQLGDFISKGLDAPEHNPDFPMTRQAMIQCTGRPIESLAQSQARLNQVERSLRERAGR